MPAIGWNYACGKRKDDPGMKEETKVKIMKEKLGRHRKMAADRLEFLDA